LRDVVEGQEREANLLEERVAENKGTAIRVARRSRGTGAQGKPVKRACSREELPAELRDVVEGQDREANLLEELVAESIEELPA
jgi:hypothetical protein